MIYICVLCKDKVSLLDLREHAIKHNPLFLIVAWDILVEIYDEEKVCA
jgi:hypothetical protein